MTVGHERRIEAAEPLIAIRVQANLIERHEDVLVLQAVHLRGQQYGELRAGACANGGQGLDQRLAIVAGIYWLHCDAGLLLERLAVAIHDRLQWTADGDRIVEGQFLDTLGPQDGGRGEHTGRNSEQRAAMDHGEASPIEPSSGTLLCGCAAALVIVHAPTVCFSTAANPTRLPDAASKRWIGSSVARHTGAPSANTTRPGSRARSGASPTVQATTVSAPRYSACRTHAAIPCSAR